MKKMLGIFFLVIAAVVGGTLSGWWSVKGTNKKVIGVIPTPTIELTPTPTVVVTPSPVSFQEMNRNFGPCVKLPVLMYHHIEEEKDAKIKNQTSLNVTPEFFEKQIVYLKEKGYTTISLEELIKFFDEGVSLPKKAVAITLDDAYEDNYSKMYPILKKYGFKATIFTPTGLVQNPDYLSWQEIREMNSSGLVYFANHTWSHHGSAGSLEVQNKEIDLADKQLAENGQNVYKIFAYPYGKPSVDAEKILTKYDYKVAFTTNPGMIMCRGKRFELPRIRIGNASLSNYGL